MADFRVELEIVRNDNSGLRYAYCKCQWDLSEDDPEVDVIDFGYDASISEIVQLIDDFCLFEDDVKVAIHNLLSVDRYRLVDEYQYLTN